MIEFIQEISVNYKEHLGIFALVIMTFLIEYYIISGKWKQESSLFLSIINYAICIFLYTIDKTELAITLGVVGYLVISLYAIMLRKRYFSKGKL